jgi:hypothetical protein
MPRLLLVLSVGLIAALAAVVRPRPAPAPIRLAVLVVFDQMRGDYVEKWRHLFPPGGFRRLQEEGVWFDRCLYPYASTQTGPGHSAMLSGATLDRTGIVLNEWYDRAAGTEVYCAGSDRYAIVPGGAERKAAAGKKPTPVGTPDRMRAETVADVLKRHTSGAGKVFGLSLKDRSAILPTGKRPDGAYWFTDRFVTSTYYRDALPPWVAAFNASGVADRWRGKTWERFRADVDYDREAGPDKVLGEGKGSVSEDKRTAQGVAFPHLMPGGAKYYEALATSPYGNELLLEFAKACVRAERLGADDVPDLLVVSFSSNDLIGHTWGPDSHEVLDVTLRSDRTVAELLAFLDAEVGAGRYTLAVTADHGACPLPEVAAAKGLGGKRVSFDGFRKALREGLAAAYPGRGADKWVEAVAGPWVYLNRRAIAAAREQPAAVAARVADWARGRPEVARAYTVGQIAGTDPADPVLPLVKASFAPDRCGDVYVIPKPYHLFDTSTAATPATGTSHGTPYEYDRHVPLLAIGPGIDGGRSDEPVTPQHAAAILADALGVPLPRDAGVTLPETLDGR